MSKINLLDISDDLSVVDLLKQREAIDRSISILDNDALIEYNKRVQLGPLAKCGYCGETDNITIESDGIWCNHCQEWTSTKHK